MLTEFRGILRKNFLASHGKKIAILSFFFSLLPSIASAIPNNSKNRLSFGGVEFHVKMSYETSPHKPDVKHIPPDEEIIPKGYSTWGLRESCSVKRLGAAIRKAGENSQSAAEISREIKSIIQNYFQSSCGKTAINNGDHRIFDLPKMANIKYDFLLNPRIQEVRFDITDVWEDGSERKEVVRGVLAMHNSQEPRPLILMKCSLMCTASVDYWSKHIIAHIFDQTPFNVLILSSNTTAEFLLDNQYVSIGGISESQQIAKIAYWLRSKSPLHKRISSLHMLGASKGGNAILYASTFFNHGKNNRNQLKDGEKIVDSSLALCPIIDFKSSSRYSFKKSLASSKLNSLLQSLLKKAHNVPVIKEHFLSLSNIRRMGGFPIIEKLMKTNLLYYREQGNGWLLPPFSGMHDFPTDIEDIWEKNNFSTAFVYGNGFGEVPTLIWSPENDSIINFNQSGVKKLINALKRYPNSNINILATEHGQHCAYSLAYGWPIASTILSSYILANDIQFFRQGETLKSKLSFSNPIKINHPNNIHARQHWEATVDGLSIHFKILRREKSGCRNVDPNEASKDCYFTKKYSTTYSSLENNYHLELFGRAPKTEVEAQALTRWMNMNLTILNQDEQKLREREDIPSYVVWKKYPSNLMHTIADTITNIVLQK